MNTDQTLSADHELAILIEKWFLERGGLKQGESVVVSITRSISSPVSVVIKKPYHQVAELIKQAAKEVPYSYVSNMVETWGNDPQSIVDRLYDIEACDLLKHRGIGKITLKLFRTALQKREIQCPWFEYL